GSEHELCHVYLGYIDGAVHANDHEIEEIRFLSAADLEAEFESQPDQFTPWFRMVWHALRSNHGEPLSRYTDV
ncbi:MAG: NUDIX domain-containing protein, partial [Gammaproteobacteria bacterium]